MSDEAEKAYEAMIETGAKAMRPECWEPEHMKVYDDLWMREERDKLRSKFRAAAEAIGLKKMADDAAAYQDAIALLKAAGILPGGRKRPTEEASSTAANS